MGAIRPVTDLIHAGLHSILPETRSYFEVRNRPVNKALHAMLTRFELLHRLKDAKLQVDEEPDQPGYEIDEQANCGLIVNTPDCVLRVLKSTNGQLPPSASKERAGFYQHNLFAFDAVNDPYPDQAVPPLNLVAVWNTNPLHELDTFSIVCPFGESENKVRYRWWRPLELPMLRSSAIPLPPEPELDEITLKRVSKDLNNEQPPSKDVNGPQKSR